MAHLAIVRKVSRANHDARIAEMEEFYEDVFNSSLGQVPKLRQNPEGRDWCLIMPAWLTYQRGHEVLENSKTFWVRKDMIFPDCIDWRREARDPRRGAYAIAFKPEISGESKYKKYSANELTARGVMGNTLLEYMALALWYKWKHDDFLDKMGCLTSCVGTRLITGEVPLGRYYQKRIELYAFAPSHYKVKLLPREVEVLT